MLKEQGPYQHLAFVAEPFYLTLMQSLQTTWGSVPVATGMARTDDFVGTIGAPQQNCRLGLPSHLAGEYPAGEPHLRALPSALCFAPGRTPAQVKRPALGETGDPADQAIKERRVGDRKPDRLLYLVGLSEMLN